MNPPVKLSKLRYRIAHNLTREGLRDNMIGCASGWVRSSAGNDKTPKIFFVFSGAVIKPSEPDRDDLDLLRS